MKKMMITLLAAALCSCGGNNENEGQFVLEDGTAASELEIRQSELMAEEGAKEPNAQSLRERALVAERKKLIIQQRAGRILTAEEQAIVDAGRVNVLSEEEKRERLRDLQNRQALHYREPNGEQAEGSSAPPEIPRTYAE